MVPVGDTARVPLVAFVPVQPPPPVHEVALVEDQVTVEILPELMLVGLADNATVGLGYGEGLGADGASPDWASTIGESASVKASAPASRGRALRSKETKAKLKLTPPNYRLFAIRDCAAINPANERRLAFLRCQCGQQHYSLTR